MEHQVIRQDGVHACLNLLFVCHALPFIFRYLTCTKTCDIQIPKSLLHYCIHCTHTQDLWKREVQKVIHATHLSKHSVTDLLDVFHPAARKLVVGIWREHVALRDVIDVDQAGVFRRRAILIAAQRRTSVARRNGVDACMAGGGRRWQTWKFIIPAFNSRFTVKLAWIGRMVETFYTFKLAGVKIEDKIYTVMKP